MSSATAGVLVVEDDPAVSLFFKLALEMEGYTIRTAAHGREALSILDTWSPDLILLDILMPVMNGWQFLEAYRERPGWRAPVIVAATTAGYRERALAQGAAAFIAKPLELEDLLETITACLHLAKHSPE